MKAVFGRLGRLGAGGALLLSLAACGGTALRPPGPAGPGPDEFMVLPSRPLQEPADYSRLPDPAPGGTNLADPDPRADAVAALGGDPAAVSRRGIPPADRTLLAHVRRYGVPEGIRDELARADRTFRRRQGGLAFLRLFPGNRYAAAYRRWALDPWEELERLRAAGVRTPDAPPRPGR